MILQRSKSARRLTSTLPLVVVASIGFSSLRCTSDDATDDDSESEAGRGAGGAGGAGEDGGAQGGTPNVARACDPANDDAGAIDEPSPLISVGATTFTNAGATSPQRLADGSYDKQGTTLGLPEDDAPVWAALQLEPGAARVLVMWTDPGYKDYDDPSGGAPRAYEILVSADSTDGEDGTWESVVEVTENPVNARAHSFDFDGMSWVKLSVTEASLDAMDAAVPVKLDELAVYDISAASDGRPKDTWFFMGDSITKGAFSRSAGGTSFEKQITAERPDFDPIVIGGGIGGELSADGVAHLEDFLALNPDFHHVVIAYGTNDSWGSGKTPSGTRFDVNMETIVAGVLAEDRVAILPTIPYASQAHPDLVPFNETLDRITSDNDLPCGADFYAWFFTHQDELSTDGVHPSSQGYRSMNTLTAAAALGFYPEP
jgi:acyl-CoA thioesterase-1